mmetsp:Transcript_12760/g.19269  ORF Transcript_12760/g.19269 Transcript_12760/m.19269 type:complete len:738 (-) Transcript_12760:53-2266(-)
MSKVLLHCLLTASIIIWKQLTYIQAHKLADGAENLRNGSLTTLYQNLKYTNVVLEQPVFLQGKTNGVQSKNNDYKYRYAYVTPCSDPSVSTMMDTLDGLLAARVFAKSGNSTAAWEIVRGIFSAQGENGFIPKYRYAYSNGTLSSESDWLAGSSYPNYPIFGTPPADYLPADSINAKGSGMLAATPLLSSIVLDIFYLSPQLDQDEDALEDVTFYLYKWHEFLHEKRSGQYNIIHPWESMMQMDSPIWQVVLADVIDLVNQSHYHKDIPQEVKNADDYPGDEVYLAELYLLDCLANVNGGVDDAHLNKVCPFGMVDIGFASILYQADLDLLQISDMLDDMNKRNYLSGSQRDHITSWITQSSDTLGNMWHTSAYIPTYTSLTNSNSSVKVDVPVADNFLPLWRGWDGYVETKSNEDTHVGGFQDVEDGERLDLLSFQMLEGRDSESMHAFGCGSSLMLRSYSCNYDADAANNPSVISPLLNYFVYNGLEVNGALSISHYIRNTTLNILCGLIPNSDKSSVDEDCPASLSFVKRYDAKTGDARISKGDEVCGTTSTVAAAVSYDMLVKDELYSYDPGIPIASVWVAVLIVAELIVAAIIMISCVLLSVNLFRRVRHDDEGQLLKMIKESRFEDRWGMRNDEAGLIYGEEYNAFDISSRAPPTDDLGARTPELLSRSNPSAPPSRGDELSLTADDNPGADEPVSWTEMARTYVDWINPFGGGGREYTGYVRQSEHARIV